MFVVFVMSEKQNWDTADKNVSHKCYPRHLMFSWDHSKCVFVLLSHGGLCLSHQHKQFELLLVGSFHPSPIITQFHTLNDLDVISTSDFQSLKMENVHQLDETQQSTPNQDQSFKNKITTHRKINKVYIWFASSYIVIEHLKKRGIAYWESYFWGLLM